MNRVLLVVVAHPDDETFGTGSVIASAAANGARVVVCCATRGEAGEDTSGTTDGPDALAAAREKELHAAANVLGASEVILLDFADSGMTGALPVNALAGVEIERVVERVAGVIDRVRPDVVVDVSGVMDVRRAGIAEHLTQQSPFAGLPPELESEILARDFFVRVVPEWTGGAIERSLFA